MCSRIKRPRGGQKGNQNARKHGFYSLTLTGSELSEFLDLTSRKGMDSVTAVLRVKIQSALQEKPVNRRVLKQASASLADWLNFKNHLNHNDSVYLKNYIRRLFCASLESEENPS